MKTLELTKATEPLAAYARKVKKNPVIVTKRGRPVAALVSISNADWETMSLSTNPEFVALIQRSRTHCKPGRGLSNTQMRRQLGLKQHRHTFH